MSNKGHLQNRFNDYGAAPNAESWGKIAGAISKEKKKKGIIWWFIGPGIAAGIIFGLFLFNYPNQINAIQVSNSDTIQNKLTKIIEKQTLNTTENDASLNTEKEIIQDKINETIITEAKPTTNSVIKIKSKLANTNKINQSIQQIKTDIITPPPIDIKTITKQSQNKEYISLAHTAKIEKQNILKIKALQTPLLAISLPASPSSRLVHIPKKSSKWELGLRSNYNYALVKNYKSMTLDYSLSVEPIEPIISNEKNNTLYTKINRPVSIDILVRYTPKRRLFFESGLSLTWLSEKSTDTSFNINKTNYVSIGIPFLLGYKIIDRKRFCLELSSGLLSEKIWPQNNISTSKKLSFLGGSSSKIGFNIKLTERNTLSITPGFSWYFGQSYNMVLNDFQKSKYLNLGIGFIREL